MGNTRFSDVDYDGTFFVHKNWDNDWVGVVFSFQVSYEKEKEKTEKTFNLQDAGNFYLFSSSHNGSMQSTWSLKRISSASAGYGLTSNYYGSGYYKALTSDKSVPGESEVLWKHPDSTSRY